MLGMCKLGFARAYAFSLYLHPEAFSALQAPQPTTSSLDALDAVLATKAAQPDLFEVAVVLKMARDMNGAHIAKGFNRSLSARVATHSEPGDDDAASDACITRLVSLFRKQPMLYRGDTIRMTWRRDNSLQVTYMHHVCCFCISLYSPTKQR